MRPTNAVLLRRWLPGLALLGCTFPDGAEPLGESPDRADGPATAGQRSPGAPNEPPSTPDETDGASAPGELPSEELPSAQLPRAEASPTELPPGAEPSSAEPRQLEFHLLYVHGVQSCDDDRADADSALNELRVAVDEALPSRMAAFEANHIGIELATTSALANLYTATPSGFNPSNSTDPLHMDDWKVGDPGCSAASQGDPCTTAYEWRYRLAQEITERFSPDAQNIILVAHSTGARTAFEVAANVGSDGTGSYDWGVRDRIAGVVSLHGMIDALGSGAYDPIGPTSFESSCKLGDFITGFGSSCAHGNGWCEYAARSSARDAVDSVAQNGQALLLTSFASCSPSLFAGPTDGPLPVFAQASPLSVGLDVVPAPGQTLQPVDGQIYGSFCHSAITSPGVAGHAEAVATARDRLLDWLFVRAPRVIATGSAELEPLAFQQESLPFVSDAVCPVDESDVELRAAGVCRHPGLFDGDDHAIEGGEFVSDDSKSCSARRWSQAHDPDDSHAARIFWKVHTTPNPDGVLGALLDR
jgi:hypothetical protein